LCKSAQIWSSRNQKISTREEKRIPKNNRMIKRKINQKWMKWGNPSLMEEHWICPCSRKVKTSSRCEKGLAIEKGVHQPVWISYFIWWCELVRNRNRLWQE
jgi:hypothetical protein